MNTAQKRLGTFEGVFTPTILTILGVILYLRLGWVVGNAGLGGALLIILLAKLVTITTGLSIASLATNVRIGAGGSYALVSRSLGLEVGSAIGIPLYMSQALGGAMYISGFTEGWLALFPAHNPLVVSSVILVSLISISLVGAKFAMKTQFIIMAILIFSLISFFSGQGDGISEIVIWGDFSKAPFWVVFSIFFPAVTGIEAGAAMSGDLKDTRKSLPVGILSAVAVSIVVYMVAAFWFDHLAPAQTLANNYTIMMDISRWRFLIIAGVLGATFSSALGSVLGAPRTLMALGQDKSIVFARVFAKRSKNGEPLFSTLITAGIIQISLILGDLNTIAPLLTMFFLITYGTINLAMAIEKGIRIPSFRPKFKVPLIFPLFGSLWCFVIMFLINPIFATIAILLILAVYIVQVKRGLRTPWGDIRNGLFNAIAEWAARTSAQMPKSAKSWKPNMMVPIEDPNHWGHLMKFIRDIVFPSGTLRLFSVKIFEDGVQYIIEDMVAKLFKRKDKSGQSAHRHAVSDRENQLKALIEPLQKEEIFTAATVIECHHFLEGISIVTQVMRGMHFPPNTLFLTMSFDSTKDDKLEEMIAIAIRETLGICILSHHRTKSFGAENHINVWLRRSSPNKDLALLMAIQLQRNWSAAVKLISVETDAEKKGQAQFILDKVVDRARLEARTETVVLIGEFHTVLRTAPSADLNIFGMSDNLDVDIMHELAKATDTSCLFIKDSGEESFLV